jgi:hypothetical protein
MPKLYIAASFVQLPKEGSHFLPDIPAIIVINGKRTSNSKSLNLTETVKRLQ